MDKGSIGNCTEIEIEMGPSYIIIIICHILHQKVDMSLYDFSIDICVELIFLSLHMFRASSSV